MKEFEMFSWRLGGGKGSVAETIEEIFPNFH